MLMVFAVTFALIILFQIFIFKKPPAQPNKPADNKAAQTSQTPAQSPAPAQPASESGATPAAEAALHQALPQKPPATKYKPSLRTLCTA